MHRYLTVWLTAFSLSAMSARYWPFLPGKLWIVLTACIVVIIHIALHCDNFDKYRVRLIKKSIRIANWYGQTAKPFTVGLFMISGIMSGMIWMASVGHWYLAWQLPQSKIQQDVIVSGWITQTRETGDHQQLILAVTRFGDRPVFPSPSIHLFAEQSVGRFQRHQQVSLRVNLKPLSGTLNPGGDRRSWYVSQGIVASGTVLPSPVNQLIAPASTIHHYASHRLTFANYSPWLRALLSGDRSGLLRSDWELMQITGTGHLFSISGLHVGMIALWASIAGSGLVALCFAPLRQWHNRVNVRPLVIMFILLLTGMYATLANWQLPVTRAWLLVLLFCALYLSRVYWSWLQRFVVMIASCITLFPLGVFGSSFYLSAGALGLLLFINSRVGRAQTGLVSKVKQLVLLQTSLSILLMPLSAGFFGSFSLLTAAINLIAIPLITLVVPVGMAGLLINYFTLAPNWLLDIAESMLDFVVCFLQHAVPWMVSFSDISFSPLASALLLMAMLLLLLPPFRFRNVSSSLLCLPFCLSFLPVSSKAWVIHVFDVGQGTAIAISRGARAMLVDTGPSYDSGSAMGSVVIPALSPLGIDTIDRVVISHGDDDHAGGRSQAETFISRDGAQIKPLLIDNVGGCQRGASWEWQALEVEVLWPLQSNVVDNNEHSCVLRISGEGYSLLIAGDISKASEYELLYLRAKMPGQTGDILQAHTLIQTNAASGLLRADVLIAPHHGSDTSSSRAFISHVAPAITVFTTGAFHRWQLPDFKVQRRYLEAGSKIYDTGDIGYLRITVAENGMEQVRFNQDLSRRWFDNRLYQED